MAKTIGYQLSEKQEAALNDFVAEQNKILVERQRKTMSPEDFSHLTCDGKYPYSGAIGGGITYCLTPTSIGTVLKVKYAGTDAELDLSDYEDW
jgi:hypothetical protein